MNTSRLEAFSDGVIAIIITITVLGIRVPTSASFTALASLFPSLLIYAWSFRTIATYWNNHHNLIKATNGVNTRVMWANMHFLFWLSLIPFATTWLGTNVGKPWPTATYSFVLLFAAIAYTMLERAIIKRQGKNSNLTMALGNDIKGLISLGCYVLAVLMAFIIPWISYILIVLVAAVWFIPDRLVIK